MGASKSRPGSLKRSSSVSESDVAYSCIMIFHQVLRRNFMFIEEQLETYRSESPAKRVHVESFWNFVELFHDLLAAHNVVKNEVIHPFLKQFLGVNPASFSAEYKRLEPHLASIKTRLDSVRTAEPAAIADDLRQLRRAALAITMTLQLQFQHEETAVSRDTLRQLPIKMQDKIVARFNKCLRPLLASHRAALYGVFVYSLTDFERPIFESLPWIWPSASVSKMVPWQASCAPFVPFAFNPPAGATRSRIWKRESSLQEKAMLEDSADNSATTLPPGLSTSSSSLSGSDVGEREALNKSPSPLPPQWPHRADVPHTAAERVRSLVSSGQLRAVADPNDDSIDPEEFRELSYDGPDESEDELDSDFELPANDGEGMTLDEFLILQAGGTPPADTGDDEVRTLSSSDSKSSSLLRAVTRPKERSALRVGPQGLSKSDTPAPPQLDPDTLLIDERRMLKRRGASESEDGAAELPTATVGLGMQKSASSRAHSRMGVRFDTWLSPASASLPEGGGPRSKPGAEPTLERSASSPGQSRAQAKLAIDQRVASTVEYQPKLKPVPQAQPKTRAAVVRARLDAFEKLEAERRRKEEEAFRNHRLAIQQEKAEKAKAAILDD